MPEIPLSEPKELDVYSFGLDKRLYRKTSFTEDDRENNASATGASIFNETTNNYSSQFQSFITNVVNQGITNNTINVGGQTLYEAVVSADGTADYTTLGAAVRAGKKRIFIKKGTYDETDWIDGVNFIQSNTIVVGEHRDEVVLNLGNNSIYIGDGNQTGYATGKITFTNADATITGSGTSWLGNISAGQWIICRGRAYKIASVTDDTHLEIEGIYRGVTSSGNWYYITGTAYTGIHLKDLTFQTDSSFYDVLAMYAPMVHCSFENLKFLPKTSTTSNLAIPFGFSNDAMANIMIRNCIIRGPFGYGIFIGVSDEINTGSIIATGNTIEGIDGIGIYPTCSYSIFSNNYISDCSTGILSRAGGSAVNGFNIFSGNVISRCVSPVEDDASNSGMNNNVWVGNIIWREEDASNIDMATGAYLLLYGQNIYKANYGYTGTYEPSSIFMANDSGSTLRFGDVVAWSGQGTVTTTVTVNDKKILGAVVVGASNGRNLRIQTLGDAHVNVNNSAASISIGDFLTNYSHAYYAKKASAGDFAFAIANNTPSNSTARITATLISPRVV